MEQTDSLPFDVVYPQGDDWHRLLDLLSGRRAGDGAARTGETARRMILDEWRRRRLWVCPWSAAILDWFSRRPEEGETVSEMNFVSGQVVDAAFQIHYQLGPGLLESVYERLLERTLLKRGLAVERQSRVGFDFDGERFDNAFRADLLVEGCVLVEVKSVVELTPVYFMQVRTYLRLLNYPVGLLINFNVDLIKHGIKRLINDRSPYGKQNRLRVQEVSTETRRHFHGDGERGRR